MLISDEYRELNRKLHESRPDYGTSGQKYAQIVRQLMDAERSYDLLDYGCGKQTLAQALGVPVRGYDPAIAELAAAPEAADIVACTDVLEHIEPDKLGAVLDDIRRCTRKVALLTIATGPAKKTLEDGRNAHLIQRNAQWWLPLLWEHGFSIRNMQENSGLIVVIVT